LVSSERIIMANTVASRKQKGHSLQKKIVQMILEAFPDLTENDVRSVPGSVPGPDVWLSEKALSCFYYDVEAKCQEALNIWAAMQQLEDRKSDKKQVLIFKRNRSETYACMKVADFFSLVKGTSHNAMQTM
jgi:hypothetical protein